MVLTAAMPISATTKHVTAMPNGNKEHLTKPAEPCIPNQKDARSKREAEHFKMTEQQLQQP